MPLQQRIADSPGELLMSGHIKMHSKIGQFLPQACTNSWIVQDTAKQ